MRTTSLKTIYLTIPELKEAIANYVRDTRGKMGHEGLYTHLKTNAWEVEFTSDADELAIMIDGEVKDENRCSLIDQEKDNIGHDE